MTDVSPLIDAMGLAPHPEGGHYRRTWTAPARVDTPRGSRHSASAIIFLLDHDEEARWHLVHSDELWIWSGPGALEVHLGGSGDAPSADPPAATTRWPPASSPPSSRLTTGSSPRPTDANAPASLPPPPCRGAPNGDARRFHCAPTGTQPLGLAHPPGSLGRLDFKEDTWVWKI